jgi:YVTN family beta-propeller protein
LQILDSTAISILSTVPVPMSLTVVSISASPDGARLYLCGRDDLNGFAGYLLIFDVSSSTFTAPMPLGVYPGHSDLSPDGSRLYVSMAGAINAFSGALVVIDTASGKVIASVPVPGYGNAIAVQPDGKAVYMSVNGIGYYIDAFRTSDLQLMGQITDLWSGVNAMAFAQYGVSHEAEAAGNTLAGKASVIACSTCSGQAAVAGIAAPGSGNTGGTLTFNNIAGNGEPQASILIYYQPVGHTPVPATVTVNGVARTVNFPALPSGASQGLVALTAPGEAIGTVVITGSQGSSSSSLIIDRIAIQ